MPSDIKNTGNLPVQLQNVAMARRANKSWRSQSLAVVDPEVDFVWAQGGGQPKLDIGYFEYFFTGQDMQIYVDGAEEPEYGGAMPIMQIAFNIEQQKTPVFGFWSHTYDAVMRGNRVVNGVFRIATTTTDYMVRLLSKAAAARANKESNYPIRGLDVDEENMQKYWTRNMDSSIALANNKHLFSSHPPFNFVVVYGIQSTSIVGNPAARRNEILKNYQESTPLMTDINERLTESDPAKNRMRYVIESVELTNKQVEITADGEVCSEVYSFFARDIY